MKLTIIGAGAGGYKTACFAAKYGIEVTIISDGPVGGTCLNEGCIPTKSLCRNAEVLEQVRGASAFGIDIPDFSFDFEKVMSRKREVVETLNNGVKTLLSGKNITFIQGKASFRDAHTVIVQPTDGGVVEVPSDYVIIATGSYSATLPIPGNNLEGVLTSKELLDIKNVPSRLCIIGAGVIGLEFASIFRSFGSQVTVLEYCKDVLPRFDTDLAKRLKQSLVKKGIAIETGAGVQSIEKDGDGLKVAYLKKEVPCSVHSDKVLMAVGRRANVGSVNLSDVGVEFTPRGITVDANMRTSVPNIFAIGDVTGGMMLAHVASFQGIKAVEAILEDNGMIERKSPVNLSIVPAAVFTVPEVAVVGMTEDECKDKGIAVKCLKSFFRANGKALALGQTEGYCKIIYCNSAENASYKEGQILGCHMFGPHCSDLIQEIAALMNVGAGIAELRSIVHAHPTLSEVILDAS